MTETYNPASDHPFDLLWALEAKLAASGNDRGAVGTHADWSGLAFYLDDKPFLAPQTDVREILNMPAVARVPGARPWLLGVANVRGELLPITDLAVFLGCRETIHTDTSRVIVLNDTELPVALLVDRVAGFHNFAPEDQRHEVLHDLADHAANEYVLGAFVRDGTAWQVFSLRKLAADPRFRDAGN